MRDYEDYSPELDSNNGERLFSRICAGFIEAVDEENGTVSLSFEDFIGTRNSIELSCDYISSVGPGWIRFMPSIGDKVLVGFRPNNEVEILRYKAISYPQLAQAAADSNPPFVFRTLRSGEFEAMSSGYAEIWGSKSGKLRLAGGLVSIELDMPSNSNVQQAAIHRLTANGSDLRFGSVRRPNPFKTTEDESSTVPGVADQEFRVTLFQSISSLATKLFDATFGKVMDYTAAAPSGVFTPRLDADIGQNLAADVNIYTTDGIQSLRFQADVLGNMRVDLPATATDGLRIVAALGTVMLNALSLKLAATQDVDISGTTGVTIRSPSVVNLGTSSPAYSVGLAEAITARIAALEAKFNAHVTVFNLHEHPTAAVGPPSPPIIPDTPFVPSPAPLGSVVVKVSQ